MTKRGYGSCGTMRENRLFDIPFKPKKEFMRLPRGSSEVLTQGEKLLVRWKDNNIVTMATNMEKNYSETVVKRWNKERLNSSPQLSLHPPPEPVLSESLSPPYFAPHGLCNMESQGSDPRSKPEPGPRPGPAPSSVSVKSDQSKEEGPVFNEECPEEQR
uniref:Uncharacterized protein n=1 Tax=Knipowitschia caucasica TaxID=637954 RepID=A0AAV2MEZ4_KNICA